MFALVLNLKEFSNKKKFVIRYAFNENMDIDKMFDYENKNRIE